MTYAHQEMVSVWPLACFRYTGAGAVDPRNVRVALHKHRRGMMQTFWQDFRYGLRVLRKSPSFTVLAVLTLALGIGASSTIFSVVDAVLLRPFSYPEPQRLVAVWETNAARNIHTFTASVPNFVSWSEHQQSFEELGAWEHRNDNRTDTGIPERIETGTATSSLFRALGVQPALGRFFLPEEDEPSGSHVAVLGNQYWRGSFNSDPQVIGQTIAINGEVYTIVGVAPPLRRPARADVWIPLVPRTADTDRGNHFILVIGRLKNGVPLKQAELDLQVIAGGLQGLYPDTNQGWSVRLESLFDSVVEEGTQRALTVLLAAVGFLLLIGCANVANLLLARSSSRTREIAVRRALGAGRARVVRQLLTESVLLALAGGTCGVLLAVWGVDLLRSMHPGNIPGLDEAYVNSRVLVFSVVVSMATGILFGLAPALQTTGDDLQTTLREGGRSHSGSFGRRRLREFLVVGQIALALVLLTGAGLLLRSFERLQTVPLGFTADRVLTAKVGLYDVKHRSGANYRSFFDTLLPKIQTLPGVTWAGVASAVPFGGYYTQMNVRLERDKDKPPSYGMQAQWRVAGGDYFKVLGIPLLRGRLFQQQDNDPDGQPAAIISEELARDLWPGEDPVGRRMLVGDRQIAYDVIGVVGGVRDIRLESDEARMMYFHYPQFHWASMTLAVRTTGPPEAMAGAIRSAVYEIDPQQPLFDVQSMQTLLGAAAAEPRMNTSLLAFFAATALLLAAVGVYGVMSYAVEQRTNEIGIRLALGAKTNDVLRMVIGQGIVWTAAGVAIGAVGALASTRVLASLLFEVSPTDPLTFGAVVLLLTAVASFACYLPARRATKVDPMTALRYE